MQVQVLSPASIKKALKCRICGASRLFFMRFFNKLKLYETRWIFAIFCHMTKCKTMEA